MGKKFNGFPGGGGNMNNMIRQAQKMQQDMAKMQEELEKKRSGSLFRRRYGDSESSRK